MTAGERVNYPSRTKEELIEANFLLRQRIKQLEESETSPKRDERGSGTSDTLYHIFFDLAPDPMAITNFDNGQLIDVNQAFVAWSHYSRDKLIGPTPPRNSAFGLTIKAGTQSSTGYTIRIPLVMLK